MSYTTDPNDPRLDRHVETVPGPQNEVYLVLSEEERAKGFVRPLRRAYKHVGDRPEYPLLALTLDQAERTVGEGYVGYEKYPESEYPAMGRYWKQDQLESGCGTVTTMGLPLCETYARDPKFYGSTYCATCRTHRPVAEFRWVEDGVVVGT
jgi:hypothetical protein